MFELADFTAPHTWPDAIRGALRERPAPAVPELAARLPAMMHNLIADVVTTELVPGMALAKLDPRRRLNELEFLFAAPSLDFPALRELLIEHGYPDVALEPGVLRGFVKGFIDMIVEHDGRFWIVDWKSNHLGDTAADYAAAPLEAAMASHAYHLQALLYTVALHRYLKTRVRDYAYDTHIGGYLYLFVRGVRPQWRDADGARRRAYAAARVRTRGVARRGDDRRCRMSTFEQSASTPPELDDIGVNLPAPADFSIALAEGFARRIGTLARRSGASAEAVKWAARGAFAASRATAEGHVCVPLAVLARRFEASSAEVRAALFASGMASDGSQGAAALRPLVIDGQGRLYLARYYDYERRLARSLVAHAGGGDGRVVMRTRERELAQPVSILTPTPTPTPTPKHSTRVCCATSVRRKTTKSTGNASRR